MKVSAESLPMRSLRSVAFVCCIRQICRAPYVRHPQMFATAVTPLRPAPFSCANHKLRLRLPLMHNAPLSRKAVHNSAPLNRRWQTLSFSL